MKIDGSCHCGKITLTAEVNPSTAMVCHCTDCQILGGGPCRTGIRSEAEKLLSRVMSPNILGLQKVEGNVCRASVESVGQVFTQLTQTNKNLIFVLASSINVISWCHPNISSVILQLVGSSRLNSSNGLPECLE